MNYDKGFKFNEIRILQIPKGDLAQTGSEEDHENTHEECNHVMTEVETGFKHLLIQ